MPLILICGQPCSGKSSVAAQLEQLLQAKGLEVVVVDEESLHLDRNEAYRGADWSAWWQKLLCTTGTAGCCARERLIGEKNMRVSANTWMVWRV